MCIVEKVEIEVAAFSFRIYRLWCFIVHWLLKNTPGYLALSEGAATAVLGRQVSLQTSYVCRRPGRPLPPSEAQTGTGNQVGAAR